MNVPCYLEMSRLKLCTNLQLFCSQWQEEFRDDKGLLNHNVIANGEISSVTTDKYEFRWVYILSGNLVP